ncbi:RNA polymerase sigma factor [Caulobacter sp. UNC279MFTsu5.1]|uniref:RNA polymerase sigma factor n=1 Tax=Caulobacter sp. UNC279MFTsu5.1 TaxID=1502775 RepID=UPI0008E52352|nr:RNA polymerase sigma factor [Caulobacter sp. UNC279MFTsu5.1]SFI52040.1 RNA polymerase sigma-70 factor, ECF subfamily [Caulobacter sp. UNC279MFTsu5.1]
MDGFARPLTQLDATSVLDRLVRLYGAWLKDALLPRYGDLAEDLAQEALLRAAAHEASGEIEHHKAFLLKVAQNLAIDRARRSQRERAQLVGDEPFRAQSTPPSQEEQVLLKQIILSLPQELREVLVLTQIKGLTFRQVAALTGAKERTVKDRLRQALVRTKAMRD